MGPTSPGIELLRSWSRRKPLKYSTLVDFAEMPSTVKVTVPHGLMDSREHSYTAIDVGWYTSVGSCLSAASSSSWYRGYPIMADEGHGMATYIGRIAKSYEVEDTEAVESYLDKHPSLYDLVIEARQEITTHFDSGTSVLLDVAVDPEGIDDPELVLRVQTKLPVNLAMERLAAFDQAWWLPNLRRSQQRLTIDLQFS